MEQPDRSEGGTLAQPSGLAAVLLGASTGREPSLRGILRVVATVVISAMALYLVYRLRTPIGYLFFAMFIAISVSAPVNRLSRRMPRGAAIAVVYAGVVLVPVLIGAILLPPAVRAASSLVSQFPSYVADFNATIANNERLQSLNTDFDLTGKLDDLAAQAAGSIDNAAAALADIGAGLVGSLFAGFTVLVMSMFMVARGPAWTQAVLASRGPRERAALQRTLDRMVNAISGYVGGALAQATIAGVASFIVLSLIGVPSPLALAVVIAILDLIPLIGATIGAVIVGVVTLFTAFPIPTIIWVVFAIVYQQFENYVIQPRIQGRAVQLDPFLIVVAAIFGGTLLGILGALVAIPAAAAIQIGAHEFISFRRAYRSELAADLGSADPGAARPPPAEPG